MSLKSEDLVNGLHNKARIHRAIAWLLSAKAVRLINTEERIDEAGKVFNKEIDFVIRELKRANNKIIGQGNSAGRNELPQAFHQEITNAWKRLRDLRCRTVNERNSVGHARVEVQSRYEGRATFLPVALPKRIK